MTGNLDAEQQNRLREIVERCPVKRTLVWEINIETTVL